MPIIRAAALALILTLAACGFHVRGQATLPFDTLYIDTASPMGVELKRNVTAGTNTKMVDSAKDAQAVLNVLAETREKVILSLNSAGRVSEYELRYKFRFRVTDSKGLEYLPTSEILLKREITFNDSAVLAKESEEGQLYRDMQTDMVQQVLRRLSVAKPAAPPAE